MKKIYLGLSVFFAALTSAQSYPDYYPNSAGDYAYYGDAEDAAYFPDDYYYNYPSDYYTNNLYESYYNDYQRSIYDVNWNRFFARYQLAPWQVQQIIMLNNSFPTYAAWNSYYRMNPDRWYYDRFYALERIMGPQIFVVFQNNYYRGYNPVVYYQNYRRQHYVTNIYVVPRYRNINVNRYRIDRVQYHQTAPRQQFGFQNTPQSNTSTPGNGFRNDAALQNNSNNNGFRAGNSTVAPVTPRANVDGFRNNATPQREATQPKTVAPQSNSGLRNNDAGLRNSAPQRRIESAPKVQQKPAPGLRNSAPKSTSGLRFTSR
ncbi:hypothetical protein [Kaistella palustris]|uniref:hypothetical protein n=1 Tax=Kaistella palustris TaxID=493376 RepID=UPI0004001FC6|nr:hypothetical protein [Kaistella palustris]